MCSALGHLYAVDSKGTSTRSAYPVWDYRWAPKHEFEKLSARLARWIHVIGLIATNADRYINACVSPDTEVVTTDGSIPIAELEGSWPERRVLTISEASAVPTEHQVIGYHRLEPQLHGVSCFELETLSGRKIRATGDHRFWSRNGWRKLIELRAGDQVAAYSTPRLDVLNANHEALVTMEEVWATLNSLRSQQSRRPHSKYRYDSREYFEVCDLRREKLTYPEIASRTGQSLRTVRRWLGEGKQPYTISNPAIQKLRDLGLVPLFLDDEKILPIARLLGAIFSDGCLSQCSYRWYSVCLVVSCEKSGGADEVARDLGKLGFRCSRHLVTRTGRINGRSFLQQTEQVRCSSLALWLLLKTLGAPSGSKTEMAFQIPTWIMRAPKRVQYEFLSTYLGGEMSVAHSSRAHPRSFNACEVRFNKRKDLADSGRTFAVQIASILTRFGVRTSRILVAPSNVQRIDGSKSVTVKIAFSNANRSMENLLRRVPVQYCPRKRIWGDLVAEYIALKARLGSRRIVAFRDWANSAREGLDKNLLHWDRIETIVPVACDDVRDLTVNSAHTYLANGFLTHNCDYDIEGSVIGYTTLQYACGQNYAKSLRMKFSTMTDKELRSAYQKLDPKPDLPLVDAGRARHELDWLYGINISRLLTTSALKEGRGYATLSTGRVQGPTLRFVVEREKEIACFVPVPFWTIEAKFIDNGQIYPIEYKKERISSLVEAENVCDSCRNASLDVSSIDSHDSQQYPPFPFDLSTLQSEAYRHFGYTPARTLAIAERLYLDALISYPRTSSQKLPPDIRYSDILGGISARTEYRSLVAKLSALSQLRPNNGPKEDPAHPAIYPTGESPKKSLFGPDAKLYDLITRRFMATFAEPSLKAISRIFLEHGNHHFILSGSKIVKLGWIEYYRPYVVDDSRPIPDLKIGDKVTVHEINSFEKFSQPPFRYNPSSLLKKMEDANIGTKATRAGIIDLLYQRGYVRDERMRASELADEVTEVMSIYCPLIIDPSFTANLEDSMQQIQDVTVSRRLVLVEALEQLRQVMLSLVENEKEIGSKLSQVIVAQRVAGVTFDSPCPKCGLKLSVVRSRGSGKRFVGCAGKWEKSCDFTLPLPQFGVLTLLSQRCKTCGFQMIQARSKGRRPLISCPLCYKTKPRTGKPSESPGTTLPDASTQPT